MLIDIILWRMYFFLLSYVNTVNIIFEFIAI